MKTIKSKREFEEVFTRGRRYSSATLHMRVHQGSEDEDGKVAFVAPKRLGNAVLRNRCKRLLRAAACSCGLPRAGTDIILMATDKTYGASSCDVARELGELLGEAGL